MDQVQDPNQFIIDVAGTKEDPFLSIIMPDASTLRVEKNCESKILSGLPTLLNFQISADTQVAFNAWRDPQKRSGWPKKLTCNYPLFLEHWIRSLNYRVIAHPDGWWARAAGKCKPFKVRRMAWRAPMVRRLAVSMTDLMSA